MGKVERKIEIDADLLRRAEANGVSLDATVDSALRAALGDQPLSLVESARRQREDPAAAQARADAWSKANAEAIKAYNERIARRGVFGEDLRRW